MGAGRQRDATRAAPGSPAIPPQRAQATPARRLGAVRWARAAAGVLQSGPTAGRGLPASGAVALALGAGVGGGAIDVLTGSGLRAIFAVAFVAGCMLSAALVRRQSLLTAVVTPPLAYVALALAAAAVQQDSSSTSWLLRQIFELLTALVTGAPVLIAATLGAVLVAAIRIASARRPRTIDLGASPR